jgi:hypothetical protein
MSGGGATPAETEAKNQDKYVAANDKARDDLRAVAKWVVGGVAATVAGVLVGTPLTSLSALEWGPRLGFAVAAGIIALGALGLLMWHAVNVIAPSSYSLPEIVFRDKIPQWRLAMIEERVRNTLPHGETTLRGFVEHGMGYARAASKPGACAEVKRLAEDYRREIPYLTSSILYENVLLLFDKLKQRLVGLVLVIAGAIAVYAYAVNPRESTPVSPYLMKVTVAPDDLAVLRNSFSPPECLTQPLDVIVLAERSTGALDVVSTAAPVLRPWNGVAAWGNCVPVRLRLDGGRLTAQQQSGH